MQIAVARDDCDEAACSGAIDCAVFSALLRVQAEHMGAGVTMLERGRGHGIDMSTGQPVFGPSAMAS